MTGRLIGALVLGLAGCAILLSLGIWQVQRLDWKRGLLDDMNARLAAPPVALPPAPDPVEHRYVAVELSGLIEPGEILVMASRKGTGAGYRVIAPMLVEPSGRRILIDRGFIPAAQRDSLRPGGAVRLRANLHWPDEVDRFTPAPDRQAGLWFARDVESLAQALGTEPVLAVVRATSENPAPVLPMPLDTAGIPDNHLNYAITWFLLAIAWAGMTVFLVWRIRRRLE